MVRTCFILIALAAAAAISATGAGIDGKWLSELKVDRGGQEFTMKVTFDLRSSGDRVTGSVTTETPRGERTSEIQNGKLDGDKFSFNTMGRGRGGEVQITWEGVVEGDVLKGKQIREGSNFGPIPFTAKRH
ncbi:MAG: hypothetical protein KIT09_31210 [Bryobacteraceae bacterium]|nr:hypothetical protein [Bryobacteraceae bacterium]